MSRWHIGSLFVLFLWNLLNPSYLFCAQLNEEDIPPEPARTYIVPGPGPESIPAPPQPTGVNPPTTPPSESVSVPPPMREGIPPVSTTLPSPPPSQTFPALPRADLPAVTLTPPSLPEKSKLPPQEQVALRFVEQGQDAFGHEDFVRARERFEKAVTVAPLQPYSYYFLGRVALAQGERKQALAFLQKAELLFVSGDQAWLGEVTCLKGTVYEELKDDAQARTAYQRCLQFVPSNLRALSALARLSVEESPPSETLP